MWKSARIQIVRKKAILEALTKWTIKWYKITQREESKRTNTKSIASIKEVNEAMKQDYKNISNEWKGAWMQTITKKTSNIAYSTEMN